MRSIILLLLSCYVLGSLSLRLPLVRPVRVRGSGLSLGATEGNQEPTKLDVDVVNIEEETKKYGFEVGMFKALTNKEGATVKPGDLLKKYGAAYLVTSISLALVSFSLCYILISQGVDVAELLKKVGIESSSTANNVGTAGLAYAVHKAASPIRFPPTVALTPVVANWLGRKNEQEEKQEK